MLDEVVIHPKTNTGKGRAFQAIKVAAIMADGLWEESGSKDQKHERPIYATFVASDSALRPFIANLCTGRPAVPLSNNHTWRRRGNDSGYEFLKSVGYKVCWQKTTEGTAATVYLPELVDLDPGMVDPEGIKFVVIPGAAYLKREVEKMPAGLIDTIVDYARKLPVVREQNKPEKDHRGHLEIGWEEPFSREALAEMVPLSYLFTLYLSNRSRAPIPPDGRFYLGLLLSCLKHGLASWSNAGGRRDDDRFGHNTTYGFIEEGIVEGRLSSGIAFMAKHEQIEALLASECVEYFKRVK